MGTMIQRYKLDEAVPRDTFQQWTKDPGDHNDLLNVTQPAVIEANPPPVPRSRADIIETNTFNSQAVSLADYGMDDLGYELSKAGAECARRAVVESSPRSLPVAVLWRGRSVRPRRPPDFDRLNDAAARGTTRFRNWSMPMRSRFAGLLDGGVDLLLVETISTR